MVKKVCKVYVFRHGKTTFNARKIFTGWLDPPLTFLGRIQARRVANLLKNKKIGIAIQTRLRRSKDTMQYVLKTHPECKKVIVDDRMIERSYGILEGTKHKTFVKKMGKRLVDLKIEGDALVDLNEQLRKKVERFLGEQEYHAVHRGYEVAAPGGESFADVEKRVEKFIAWLTKYIKKHKVNVAISAHGNSIRLFRKIWEKKSRKESIEWFIPYDKVFEYSIRV